MPVEELVTSFPWEVSGDHRLPHSSNSPMCGQVCESWCVHPKSVCSRRAAKAFPGGLMSAAHCLEGNAPTPTNLKNLPRSPASGI